MFPFAERREEHPSSPVFLFIQACKKHWGKRRGEFCCCENWFSPISTTKKTFQNCPLYCPQTSGYKEKQLSCFRINSLLRLKTLYFLQYDLFCATKSFVVCLFAPNLLARCSVEFILEQLTQPPVATDATSSGSERRDGAKAFAIALEVKSYASESLFTIFVW